MRFAIAAVALPLFLSAQNTVQERHVMMPTRDNVKLATDIYLPPGADPVPVLLHSTPYDKSAPATIAIARFFAQHGYIAVVQDTRGRHHSEGTFSKYYKYDASDGFDTIEWAAKLPRSNGKVGMWGTSYAAHTQADAAKLNPPSLKAVVINMGGMSNAWDHSVRFDGAFEMGRQLTWAWDQIVQDTKDPAVKDRLTKEKVTDWFTILPIRKGASPLSAAPNFEGYYLDELEHVDYDEHWQSIGMQWENFYAQTADIPMIHIGGWYDIYLRGTIENFQQLTKLKKAPERLLIGPWTHHGNTETFAGNVDFGPDAAIKDFDTDFHLRWFDHYLKGLDTPVAKQSPIRVFTMGTGDGHRDANGRLFHGGYWRDESKWPPANTHPANFYLHADGTLSSYAPTPTEAQTTTYTFDPMHPVPTLGGGVSRRLKDGAFDQRALKLQSRTDVRIFQTPPLTQAVDVIGPVEVELFATSSATSTDFTAKLIDVYPDGFELNLTDAIIRKPMKAGEITRLTIRPFDTANHFKPGHRIRVDISSSNFPRFDVNPVTTKPVNNTIHHTPTNPSRLILHTQ